MTPSATNTNTITPSAPGQTTYTVRTGDTLSRIARLYGLTTVELARANNIGNPDTIRVGQVLIIPTGGSMPTATLTPSPTAIAPITPTHTPTTTLPPLPEPTATITAGTARTEPVLPGDSLSRFAQRHGVTVQDIIRLNNIQNPDLILAGTRLIISADGGTPTPDEAAATPGAPTDDQTTANPFGYGRGISLSLQGQDPTALVQSVISLNVEWAKIEADWDSIEPSEETYDFAALDAVVFGLSDARIRLLLTLDNSPTWARSNQLEDGPPDDFADFARFAGVLAGRYAGRVTAYQVWNEPNLRREWLSDIHRIDPMSYYELFLQTRAAITTADPAARVITAGLAPTGFNDGVNALNDRLYLQALYDLGIGRISDGIAVHALGFANPPDSRCCEPAEGVSTHFESRSFYFRDTIEDYHAIAQANDDPRPLWVTKFGWGTADGSPEPSADFVYITYTDPLEQAQYIPDGFAVGQSLGYVGPMFLYNLNGCSLPDGRAEPCYFSLTGADGTPRAAFNALRALPR
jgi:LysM repeat protein